ncbi:MAG: ribosome-associated translation inhibitor RaiA [Patescibacteria group bacterium]
MLTINIKTVHMQLTPAIRSYAEEKVRMIERFLGPRDADPFVQVELGQTTQHHHSGDIFRAEMNLTTADGALRAVAEKDDLYAAIDAAKDSLVDELQRTKSKKTHLLRKGGRFMKNILRSMGLGEN